MLLMKSSQSCWDGLRSEVKPGPVSVNSNDAILLLFLELKNICHTYNQCMYMLRVGLCLRLY